MKQLNSTSYERISEIESSVFEALGCAREFYFSKAFLTAFEVANEHITYQYLVFSKGEEPVGFAILQHLEVALDGAVDNLPLSARIARSVQCYLNGRTSRITVCGNIFLSGSYGLYVKDGFSKRKVYGTLSRKLKSNTTSRQSSIYFLKDFNAQEDTAASIAEQYQFQSFAMEPNMRLRINWPTFTAYKEQLKSKYRVKINKADSTSAPLEVKSFNAAQIMEHRERLQQLYDNVTEGATFNAVNLRVETYAHLKRDFKDAIIFNTYWDESAIVGFLTAFHVENRLDAHFIGMDYGRNKQFSIYPRMLNDYVRLAIALNVSEVNLGRTASEIKSTLGALPEQLRCYVKHKRSIANMLFKPLIRQIKMTEFKQHTPFKSRSK